MLKQLISFIFVAVSVYGANAIAQTAPNWPSCTGLDDSARLACYDQVAKAHSELQTTSALRTAALASNAATAAAALETPLKAKQTNATTSTRTKPDGEDDDIITTRTEGCTDRRFSALSRFWELENGSDCDTFGIRGYRPISLSVIASDSVNDAPSSPSPGHTATAVTYQRTETRLQLSVRTKLAKGLLTPKTEGETGEHDSLWFGYTQASYWQLFNGTLSRPFRNTDHEPELIYVYPTTANLPGGWHWRYSGVGVVHQSNGQTLPLSRSWNRVYLMAGIEKDYDHSALGRSNNTNYWRVMARAWQRLPEKTNDDNPDITDRIGRGELQVLWDKGLRNTYSATLRKTLSSTSNGSLRLEWQRTLGDPLTSSLRFHTQLFSGYGDSLVDYNRRRVVLSVGLSLVDF